MRSFILWRLGAIEEIDTLGIKLVASENEMNINETMGDLPQYLRRVRSLNHDNSSRDNNRDKF